MYNKYNFIPVNLSKLFKEIKTWSTNSILASKANYFFSPPQRW